MPLDYLDFDYSEDSEGTGTLDAMACVAPSHLARLEAEIAQVLGWAEAHFGAPAAPIEEGGSWHFDLQGTEETSTPLVLHFDAETQSLTRTPGAPGAPRTTLTLSLSGTAGFCADLRAHFDLE
ncbi:MAG: hypothetical protein PHI55_05200 [Burkholderiaceae bacterium]|nr:hypothetical protein [Burkholderiaceae bacterium]